jgi:hypothetical protein
MNIKVYFETQSPAYAEHVATFHDSGTYTACFPALDKLREANGFDIITESVEEDES